MQNQIMESEKKTVSVVPWGGQAGFRKDDKVGYSIIQGKMGDSFDIVLAVKQRDDTPSKSPVGIGNATSRQVSGPPRCNEVKLESTDRKVVTTVENEHEKTDSSVTCGPWGGSGGMWFDDGTYTGIRQINLSRNVGLVWLKVLYDYDGEAVWGSRHGGTGGFKNDKVVFDYPNEILTHITGTYGPLMYMGPIVVKSVTFHTNRGKHGPFGEEQGQAFTSKGKEGRVVGIHGKEGLFVDAIGIHMVQGKVPPAPVGVESDRHLKWSNKFNLPRPMYSSFPGELTVVKEPSPSGPGPWGGDSGRPWDDGVFSGIKQIFLTRSEAICSIQIEYDRSGQSVWSVKHGGNGGVTPHQIRLEYPNEVLTCISGYYGSIGKEESPKVIRSMTFYTSRGKYGPFGEEVGNFFTSTKTEGKVVGFHGRSSLYLDAIGVHMQHWLGNQKLTKSRYKMFY